MLQIRNVEITHAGRRWNASWHVVDGEVVVSSAYGSERAKAKNDPKATAAKLLTKIVKART